jgi:hypothetical protein
MQLKLNCEWELVKFDNEFAVQYTGNDSEKVFPSDITSLPPYMGITNYEMRK